MRNNTHKNIEWFEEWFNSPYYHLLYKNRDHREAENFIANLINYLDPTTTSFFVDVACGKGRHSRFLHKQGYSVDGFDLSENSIIAAKEHEADQLNFFTNDIRIPLNINHYDYAFNLFTSFGYFDEEEDNQLAINSIVKSLKKNGLLVLDFMNCSKVIANLKKEEAKVIEDVTFNIKRNFKEGYITKNIVFKDKNKDYHFQEKVKAISLNTFKNYFSTANLKIEAIFGDYNLNSFDINKSDRLILIAKKQ